MSIEPQPLYQELYLPVIPPEELEKLNGKKREPVWRRIVIDMNGDVQEETPYGE